MMSKTKALGWLLAFDTVFGLISLVMMLSFTIMLNCVARITQGVIGPQDKDS
jgi:hypothetical protein